MTDKITADLLLRAYGMGVFPMAESQTNPTIHWIDPRKRGIFELSNFHISKSLSARIRKWNCTIRTNTDFEGVLLGCADRSETWINPEISALYTELHHAGHAHSLEVWEDDTLVGGVYGVVLGAAFFGESMFSRRPDASKVALAWLVHRLRAGGFQLFDTQFLTPHLASLGAIEISRAAYHRRLAQAISQPAQFDVAGYQPLPASVAAASSAGTSPSAGASSTSGSTKSGTSQRSTQTS
ncbi:MAG: hypothetical protein RIR95_496 [Pseudomonadota bacterium]|jgi:leucyl/phenylalanyl-tRNA--protein transferase